MPKCVICKEKFTPQFSSLEKACREYDCRVAYALKVVDKQKEVKEKRKRQESNAEKKVLRERIKTLSDWKSDFQKEINSIVREIDNGWPCIATNSFEGKRNAGHYISVGSNDSLRFNLENIFVQSEHSNTWKSGDTIRYQQGIIKSFGKEYLEYMNSLQSMPPIKLTSEEIKEKIPVARGILKWLKLQARKFSLQERLELRKRFNTEIGIYK